MRSSPQATVDLVWDRVLLFAMNVTDPKPENHIQWIRSRQRTTMNARRLQYLFVCKTFHVRYLSVVGDSLDLMAALETRPSVPLPMAGPVAQ